MSNSIENFHIGNFFDFREVSQYTVLIDNIERRPSVAYDMITGVYGGCFKSFVDTVNHREVDLHNIKGIPLTEEVIKCTDLYYYTTGDDYHFNGVSYIKDEDSLTVLINCGNCDVKNVSYLHELQNLTFELSGRHIMVDKDALNQIVFKQEFDDDDVVLCDDGEFYTYFDKTQDAKIVRIATEEEKYEFYQERSYELEEVYDNIRRENLIK